MTTGACNCGRPLGAFPCECLGAVKLSSAHNICDLVHRENVLIKDVPLPSTHNKVDSPSWYTKGGIQAIDYIAAKELNFNRGNVIKYTTRAGHKPGDFDKELEDLKKARVYLTHEIDRLERLMSKD